MTRKLEAEMNMDLALDTLKVSESLNSLKQLVRSNTSAWKAQAAEMRSAGDYMGATQAKIDGLKTAMSNQQREVDVLRQKQSELNLKTAEGSEKYVKYETQINNISRSMSNYSAQLTRAETSMRGYESGVTELSTQIRRADDVNKSYVDKLKAENRQYSANRAELLHNKTALADYGNLYTKQVQELNQYQDKLKSLNSEYNSSRNKLNELKVAGKENSAEYQEQAREVSRLRGEINLTNESLNKQQLRVNETGTSIGNSENKIKQLNKTVGNMGPRMSGLADHINNVGNKANSMGNKFLNASHKMSMATMGIGIGVAYGAKKYTDLQHEFTEISNLAITSGEKQSEVQKNVNSMYKDGEAYSTKYGISQQSIADGYKELIKRGYDSNQALGAQKSLVEAAKASGDDYNDVIHNTTATLESFGMKVDSTNGMMKNTKEVVNNMAYASDLTATDFSSMGKAMEYVGTSANQSGITLHETASAIGILSNNGLEADKAGTGLRKVLISLQSPSAEAKDSLNKLGLTTQDFVDKSGKMKSMSDIFGEINDHSKNMSQSEKGVIFHNLFGTTGQQAGGILSANAEQLKELDNQVKNSTENDYVHKLAKKNMESYKSQIDSSRESINALAMTLGSAALPAINNLLKASAHLADKFNQMPSGTKKLITYFALAVAAIAPLSWIIGNVLKGIKHIGSSITWTMRLFSGKSKAATQQEEYSSMIKRSNKLLEEQMALQKSTGGGTGGTGTSLDNDISDIKGNKTAKEASSLSRVEKNAAKTGKLAKLGKFGSRAMRVVGAGDVIYSGMNLIGMNDQNRGEKLGGSTGSLTGGLTGGAVGSFAGPIGTMIGGMIGSYVGEAVGKSIGPSIQKNLAKNHIAQDFTKWWKGETKSIQAVFDSYNPKPKKLSMKSSYDALNKETKKFYSDNQKMRMDNVKQLLKTGSISKAEYDKQVAAINLQGKQANKYETMNAKDRNAISKYYAQEKQKLESSWNKKIADDRRKFGTNSIQVQKDVDAKKKDLDKQRIKFATKVSSDEAKLHTTLTGKIKLEGENQNKILQDLYKKRGKLSKDNLNDMVWNAKHETETITKQADDRANKTIKSAKDQRDKTIKAAKEEFGGNSDYAKQQREKIIENANKQYSDTEKAARQQKNATIKHAELQKKKVSDEAHNQNKSVSDESADQRHNAVEAAKGQKDGINKYTDLAKDAISIYLKTVDPWWTTAYNGIAWISNKLGKKMETAKTHRYANGTGALRGGRNAITEPTLAMLNDGNDSPETDNRELAMLPDGKSFIPKERNWTGVLPAGTEVFNASETKSLLGQRLNHFKNGTGIFDQIQNQTSNFASGIMKGISNTKDDIEDFAGDLIDDSEKVFKGIFPSKSLNSNNIFAKDLAENAAYGNLEKTAKSWWSKLIKSTSDEYGSSNPAGSGVERWRASVKRALKENGLSTSKSMIERVLRQINTESGGNPTAIGGNDGLADGNAIGLMQVKPGTFNSYAFPGHHNQLNGYDSLLAGLNYAKHTYGNGLSFLGKGHGYANGGMINKHQMIEVGEGNQPEMVVPLSSTKSSRAWELIGKSASIVAKNDPSVLNSNDKEANPLKDKLDNIEKMFESLLGKFDALNSISNEQINAIHQTAQTPLDRQRQDGLEQNLLSKQNMKGAW